MNTPTEALQHYHARYNNATFRAVQEALVRDLSTPYQANTPALQDMVLKTEPIHSLLNLLTDVCLEISGHPEKVGRRERLIRALGEAVVSEEVVRLMGSHLENFEDEGSVFSADFENATLALLQIGRMNLYSPKAHASLIHSKAGNAANALIAAAESLLQVAKLLLVGEPSKTYLNEKLQDAEQHLSYAKEAIQKPDPAPIEPYKTLLLAGEATYVGLVTQRDANGVRVTWYKWGFTSEEVIRDWLPLDHARKLIVSAEDCSKRFGGLPSGYTE